TSTRCVSRPGDAEDEGPMLIRLGYEIAFEVPAPAPMLLILSLRPEREASVRRAGGMRLEPEAPLAWFTDGVGNRCARVVAPAGTRRIWADLSVEDDGRPDEQAPAAAQLAVPDLPAELLVYLLGSRYCEVDRLTEVAWRLFGHVPEGWPRVRAVC